MTESNTSQHLNRDYIVSEAFKMIDEEGLGDFSLRALARRMGVSPMALYTYFSSKDELVDAVFVLMRQEFDNAPVPGERWDDTIRRTTISHRAIDLRYPNIYRALSGWMPEARQNTRRIFQIFQDQGMPEDAFKLMWGTVEAFVVGFVHQEIAQNKALVEETDGSSIVAVAESDSPWLSIARTAFDDESFKIGLELVIEGLRHMAGPESDNWCTPEDPEQWTWY